MKAEEARKLTHDHSKRMQYIYKKIENDAKTGSNETWLFVSEASKEEIEVLKLNGYNVEYNTSEIDGGQMIVVKW